MLKRVLAYFILSVMIFQSSWARATDLDAAFNSLVGPNTQMQISGPGSFSTSTRNVFVAGGVDVRFPRQGSSLSLISINPPSISAGCGGISAHFGGFSFVSGAQIEQLIKNIGQNAVGMVVSVVIKTLCPICDAVIQAMTKLSQDAARMAINSCEVATSLVTKLASETGLTADKTKVTNVCQKSVAVSGEASDALSSSQGIDSLCGNIRSGIDYLSNLLHPSAPGNGPDAGKGADGAKNDALKEVPTGNITWQELNRIYGGPLDSAKLATVEGMNDYRNRLLLMNVLGMEIVANKDSTGKVLEPMSTRSATISVKSMFDLFMCGAPGAYVFDKSGAVAGFDGLTKTPSTRQYCKHFYDSSANKETKGTGQDGGYGYYVFECGNDVAECLDPQPVLLQNSRVLAGAGFLPQTELLLYDAVEAVRENRTSFNQQFLQLVNTVNFPVYQAVNAAAVYPASTHDLMSTMSILVAESMVYAKLDEMLRPQGKNMNAIKLSKATLERIYNVFEVMNKTHLEQKESYGRMMAVQEGAVHSIRQINLAVQKQVLTPELLGNQKFGSAVANSVSDSAQ